MPTTMVTSDLEKMFKFPKLIFKILKSKSPIRPKSPKSAESPKSPESPKSSESQKSPESPKSPESLMKVLSERKSRKSQKVPISTERSPESRTPPPESRKNPLWNKSEHGMSRIYIELYIYPWKSFPNHRCYWLRFWYWTSFAYTALVILARASYHVRHLVRHVRHTIINYVYMR